MPESDRADPRHNQADPFKRNDQMLGALPIGLIVFCGSGIFDNLADTARTLGIPLLDLRKGGGGRVWLQEVIATDVI